MENTQNQSILIWIQSWYLAQCNEEWEHSYGVEIGTLDNPGWSVIIDLVGTKLENISMEPIMNERNEDDWICYSIVDNQFRGYGGPENLSELLKVFRNLAIT